MSEVKLSRDKDALSMNKIQNSINNNSRWNHFNTAIECIHELQKAY